MSPIVLLNLQSRKAGAKWFSCRGVHLFYPASWTDYLAVEYNCSEYHIIVTYQSTAASNVTLGLHGAIAANGNREARSIF